MTKQEIQSVLADPTYAGLLAIYNVYKISDKHDQFFGAQKNAAPGSLHFNLLQRKVQDIFRKLSASNGFDNAKTANIPAPKKSIDTGKIKLPDNTKVKIIKPNPLVKYEDLPEDMQALYNEIGQINSEMKSFHARMKVAKDDATRKECLDKLCELEEKGQDNWNKIDTWWNENKTGTPGSLSGAEGKAKEDPAAMKPEEIAKKIDAAKRYISRYKDSKDPKQITKCKEYWVILQNFNVQWIPPVKKEKSTEPAKNTKGKDKGKQKK